MPFKHLYLGALAFLLLCAVPLPLSAVQKAPEATVIELVNPIGGKDDGTPEGRRGIYDLRVTAGGVIAKIMGVIGSLAFLAFVFGGFTWLTSAGNSDRVKKGSTTMLYATIGLFVIFGAYAILNTIISGIARPPGSPVVCDEEFKKCQEECKKAADKEACNHQCDLNEAACYAQGLGPAKPIEGDDGANQ